MSLQVPQDRISQLTRLIDAFLRTTDLSTVSVKKVRTHLQNQVTYDISPYKAALSGLIQNRFDLILDEQEAAGNKITEKAKSEVNSHSLPSPADTASPPAASGSKKRKSKTSTVDDARLAAELHAQLNSSRTRTTRAATTGTKKKGATKRKSKAKVDDSDVSGEEGTKKKKRKTAVNRNNPFNALLLLSEPLQELTGETMLSRPETVKKIWDYVKANNLQDPEDKRFIVCDEKLNNVFNVDKIHMFKMNKVLSSHFSPLPPEMQAEANARAAAAAAAAADADADADAVPDISEVTSPADSSDVKSESN